VGLRETQVPNIVHFGADVQNDHLEDFPTGPVDRAPMEPLRTTGLMRKGRFARSLSSTLPADLQRSAQREG
jgi:hypothetical protein